MDGMSAYNTDVEATIDRCKQLVGDESLITIDVLQITAPGSVTQWSKPSMDAWTNHRRRSEL